MLSGNDITFESEQLHKKKMSFFRRRSEKHKASTPAPDSSNTSGLYRSSSLRNDRNVNIPPPSPKLWKNNNDRDLASIPRNGSSTGLQRPHSLLLSADALKEIPAVSPDSVASPVRTTSRLSKTLLEIIRDKDGLSCFIDFMKSEKAENLIQFWCDAESFQATTLMRLRTHALQSVSKSALLKRRSNSSLKRKEKDLENSTIQNFTQNDSEALSKVSSSSSNVLTQGQITPGDERNDSLDLQMLNSDVACVDEKFQQHRLSSSHVPAVPNQTPDVEPERLIDSSNSAILHSRPSSLSSHASQNQNNKRHKHISRFGEGEESDRCGIECNNISHEKTQIHDDCEQHSPSSTSAAAKNPNDQDLDTALSEDGKQDRYSSNPSNVETEDLAAKLRKSIERDAVTIFSNYIAKEAPKPIGVGGDIITDTISKICREDGQVDPRCFTSCQDIVFKKMDTQYYQCFKDSPYNTKHQINVLTTGTVYLPDILLAENALCYFLEYMEQEGAGDLMQLWLAVDNFQQQLTLAEDDYDSDQAQNDAMVIYDKYFSLQATQPMGFDDKLRFTVEENICREEGPLPDCFTEAKNIVLKSLDKMYFGSYLQSQIYYRYLSDLVSTVQMAEDMHHKPKGHRRTESDASSEHSLGSQSASEASAAKARNTLLAVDTRKDKKNTPSAIEGDFSMNMDMFNPDDLWKRTSPGGMSLGSVNEFGQFVSNFDHDITDKKKGGGFLQRWKGKEKEQEEVALRIAQMIINDVTTMTHSSDSSENAMKEDEAEGTLKDSDAR